MCSLALDSRKVQNAICLKTQTLHVDFRKLNLDGVYLQPLHRSEFCVLSGSPLVLFRSSVL